MMYYCLGKGTERQAKVMREAVEEIWEASGQKANLHKSKLLFVPKMQQGQTRAISSICQIPNDFKSWEIPSSLRKGTYPEVTRGLLVEILPSRIADWLSPPTLREDQFGKNPDFHEACTALYHNCLPLLFKEGKELTRELDYRMPQQLTSNACCVRK
ncbi:hypothetical protein Acr_00g0063710 [Actinidia rufa]|uniref:Uncharacterized protein n=1 Tax=Actinidia rufa TaxID=165716 RepID=A0A7J0DPB7_9ERIC|nr:hypothetical protein Acr_00g0063710 [Actinidia rufa]